MSTDGLTQDPHRCQSLPNALHPFHKISNNNILKGGTGGLLLKLLKITCYDCILQPLSAQSEDTSSSSCLSWSPCTCTSSLSTSDASTPQQGAARLQKPWEVGTLSSKASWVSAQPGRGWPVTQVLHYVNETFGKRCCRRQKGERAKIMNKK